MIAYILSFLLLIIASAEAIVMIILTEKYESLYFICIVSSLQFSLALVIIYILYSYRLSKINDQARTFIIYDYYYVSGEIINNGVSITTKTRYILMVQTGICMSFGTLLVIYSANPDRTPIILQLILSGLNIIPSFLLTKYYLKKNVSYNVKLCVLSLITLFISIGILVIPINNFSTESIIWPLLFLLGQLFRILGYILQEKYILDTHDNSTLNKLYNITSCRCFQFVSTLLLFWLDIVIGYESNFDPLVSDLRTIKYPNMELLLLEMYSLLTILFCIVIGFLNTFSTNYSSITLMLISPIIAAFFSLFPQLDDNNEYQLYITMPALFFSLLSSFFWFKGEKI